MNDKKVKSENAKNAMAARHPRLCGFFAFLLPLCFFWACFFYLESLLSFTNSAASFGGLRLLRCLFSSLALGGVFWLFTELLPWKKWAVIVSDVFLFIFGAYTIAQCCVLDFFGSYYQVSFMFSMTGQVAGNFLNDALGVVLSHLWFFPLAFVPGIVMIIFRRRIVPSREKTKPAFVRLAVCGVAVIVLSQGLNVLLCHMGNDTQYYTSDFSANSAIPRFGFINALRLELKYAVFGQDIIQIQEEEIIITQQTQETEEPEETEAETEEETEAETEEEEETVYGYNVLDIDFDALIESDTDSTLLAMDEYFSSQNPTQQNEYTGLFEGKNLIFITAEAFSYAIIDEELTPTLYMLANNGFVFSDYYQPDWKQSTTGGEFAALTGLIPTWVNGSTSFAASADDLMPYGLGWIFNSLGYTSTAWHNNEYTYYSRNLSHPNLGYTYYGIGNGLELESAAYWPASDLEMIQETIGSQIEAYVNDGTLFNCYYMTVSGHCNYSWSGNNMCAKNREAAEGLDYSETVQAYIACQLELEYALEYLVEALEEAGIADDTVIVLTADHYPYALSTSETDYYTELTGIDDNEYMTSRYKNTLILWSGSIEEPIEIDTACTAIDILPTLLNLFGIEYDSRLLSGRDILAPDVSIGEVSSEMHIAVFPDAGYGYSWITAAGTYEAYTGTFTAKDGVELEDEEAYVEAVNSMVKNRFNFANYIITYDYYSHIFTNWQEGLSLPESIYITENSD